jgi:hypothetical protein
MKGPLRPGGEETLRGIRGKSPRAASPPGGEVRGVLGRGRIGVQRREHTMRDYIKSFIAKHPYVATGAAAAAGYYGGPAGAEALEKVARALGLV